MSVGQGKALRAHQHKHHQKVRRSDAKLAGIKDRMEQRKAAARKILAERNQ